MTVIFLVFFLLECAGYYLARQNRPAVNRHPDTDREVILRRENSSLRKKIAALKPRGVYIIVDTARNTLYLKKGDKTVVKAVVSSGSGNILTDPSSKRTWIFDTPRGEFIIRSKIKNPDWIKPDWAFIEEGLPVPDTFRDRVENGMMGRYAFAFGNGYFIHGTLYTRLLGRNVTHGCIRVGDEELERLYAYAGKGTRVIIF